MRLMKSIAALAAVAVPVAVPTFTAGPAGAAGTGAIHPGVQLFTNVSPTTADQCTANFIYTNGMDTFIGQAAHCSSTGAPTDTNGCTSPSAGIGASVQIGGATHPGTMVYNSWLTMQAAHESDPNVCQFNDLALVKIDPSDVANVDPNIPHWGGPTGVNTTGLTPFTSVYGYGNSLLRLGITLLSPKLGISQGDDPSGWSHTTTMLVTPGIPGDSGGPLLDGAGRATGILSTLGIGIPGLVVNNYGDVGRELAYANAHGFAVSMVNGTKAFNGGQLPLGT